MTFEKIKTEKTTEQPKSLGQVDDFNKLLKEYENTLEKKRSAAKQYLN